MAQLIIVTDSRYVTLLTGAENCATEPGNQGGLMDIFALHEALMLQGLESEEAWNILLNVANVEEGFHSLAAGKQIILNITFDTPTAEPRFEILENR